MLLRFNLNYFNFIMLYINDILEHSYIRHSVDLTDFIIYCLPDSLNSLGTNCVTNSVTKGIFCIQLLVLSFLVVTKPLVKFKSFKLNLFITR